MYRKLFLFVLALFLVAANVTFAGTVLEIEIANGNDSVEEEASGRQRTIDLANKLAAVELRVAEARLEALEAGEAGITIDTTGLDPILDLLLVTIIENAQVRASVEGAAFLVDGL